ncbi:hypothetical protein DITRI_Ditri01bG0013500 [Diplodiscus trichospermus]
MDAKYAVDTMYFSRVDVFEFDSIVRACRNVLHTENGFSMCYVRRRVNGVAHALARLSHSHGDEICLAVNRARLFKAECDELGKRVNQLSQMLEALFCFITSAPTSLYLLAVNSIVAKVRDHFELAMAILYKCKRRSLLQRLFTSLNANHFRHVFLLLDASISDMQWLLMKEIITTIVNRLSRTSPISDQIKAANFVATIAEHNPKLKEYDLIRENVIWRLITLLSSEPDNHTTNLRKRELKISCSNALWVLARESVSNCRTLTETKGMFCLAKFVETERDELQYNCLMIIREITAIAESNSDFRHSTFKSTSPVAKAVVHEVLRIIDEFDDTKLRIPAIKSIGSLARSFLAKETNVISRLVALLDNTDQEVAMEAAIALQKFVCTENNLCSEHSKSIMEFNGVPLLMKLLFSDDKKLQPHGLALICYLAKQGSNINVLIKAGALTALQTTGLPVAAEHPELKGLVSDAISKLQSNQTDKNEELDSSISKCSIEQIIKLFDGLPRRKASNEGD